MKRLIFLLLLAAALPAPAPAQDAPPIPNVLLIVREEIKPGEMPAHEQEAIHFVRLRRRINDRHADARDGRIAMTPVAGNENEVTYLWPYASFADMEKKRKAADALNAGAMRADFEALPDARLHASQRDVIAGFRPDLSYNIAGRSRMPQARYVSMQTLRIKPGHEEEYWEARRRILHKAYEATGIDAAYAVFGMRGGAPVGTFYILRAMKSLAEMDRNIAAEARAKMGADRDDWDKVVQRAVVAHDVTLYAINPRLSVVGADFAAQDAAAANFWNPPLPEPRPATAANRRTGARRHHRR